MASDDETNGCFPSTTWTWRKVRVLRPPKAGSDDARRAASQAVLSPRDLREPLTITVKFRGGAEAWWEIRARGRTFRRPGHVAIHDLMREICNKP